MIRALVLVALLVAPALALATPPTLAEPDPLLPVGSGELTLLTLARQVVAVVDEDGTPVRVWNIPARLGNVLDVELMANGHLLVTVGGYTGFVNEAARVPAQWPAYPHVDDPVGSAIVELDENSLIVWQVTHAAGVPLHWLHDVDYVEATDTFLVADTTASAVYEDRVLEIDRTGHVLWAHYPGEDSYPNDVDGLPNGNVLISLRNRGEIIEVDPDTGRVVWSYGGPGGPLDGIHNPDRLPNGNTIVADSNNDRIVEVDLDGNVVWEFGGVGVLRWPRDADVLPNGNVLVTDSHNFRVIEVTRAGEIVWEYMGHELVLNYDSDRVNAPPVVTIREPAEGATVASPVRFDVAATDPSLASATYRILDLNSTLYVDPEPLPVPAAPWTRALAPGEYRLEVTARDAGGEGGGWPQDDSVPESTYAEVQFRVD